jgi:hypothetical protein
VQFVPEGSPDKAENFNYMYDNRHGNKNDRTIQKFSTDAAKVMKNCDDGSDCYHDDFQKFINYYGDTDYGDKWIIAAAEGLSTEFTSNRGNANFTIMTGNRGGGRAEAMDHGSVFLNVWMWVIHQMEMATHYCSTTCTADNVGHCQDDAVAAWDQAVAYYVGSLEGQEGSGDGVLLYALADSRAKDFKTKGFLSDEEHGTSYINLEILHLFGQGQSELVKKEDGDNYRCINLDNMKDQIVNLMKVPLVQTVYRYAWKREYETDDTEKHLAKVRGICFNGAYRYATAIHSLLFVCREPPTRQLSSHMSLHANHLMLTISTKP